MYKDLFSCKDKVAVVTGGAGLIGREIVRALHEFGAEVYVADINKEKTEELMEKTDVKYARLDVTSEISIKKALRRVVKYSGRIDVLINAAYPKTKDWSLRCEDVPFDSWKKNVNFHLGGYFLCCRMAAEEMSRKKGGSIINISSIYGMLAPDFSIYEGTRMTMPVAYSAIKGGIISLTKYIATYYAKYKIRANTISPGGIFNGQAPSFVDRYTKKTPLGRMGLAKDIAGAVVYLASDASSYVTGCNLVVDGGWSAW